MALNLAPPSRIPDTSWIRPGKAIREMTLTTAGALRRIEFAVRRSLQYVLFDGGWYGHPLDEATDAGSVGPWMKKISDPDNYPGLDLSAVLDYAKKAGIGIWLYVDQHALERQLDRIVPLYASWGVAGIKFGFVHVGPQGWNRWLIDAVSLCARHRLMVDIHDEYRPTGMQRTWPNIVNVEGVMGNEQFPPPRNNLVLPFTRFVDGMADYTVCIYDKRLKTRRTHQLAMTVCYFSPFEMLYWYDRPEQYAGEPELAFLEAVPTVWDQTVYLDGEPGEFVAVARRAGGEWFVGAMNADEERGLELSFAFLTGGCRMTVYRDGPAGRNDVVIEERVVGPESVLGWKLLPAGGLVARARPVV